VPFRVLAIDDHRVLSDALAVFVNDVDGMDMLPPQTTAEAGLALAMTDKPDAIIVDLNLPDRHGIDLIGDLKANDPQVKILVLTALKDRDLMDEALAAGASMTLEKSVPTTEVIEALKSLQAATEDESGFTAEARAVQTSAKSGERLTRREKEVLIQIASGKTTPQIAEALGVTASTAETHRENLMRKLDLHSVAELTTYALRRGLLEP
jgi:DNA-binding NarL/FixJ family response regulator